MTHGAKCLSGVMLAVLMFSFSTTASAGLLDKLNQATKKLNDYNARQQGGQSGQASDQSPDQSGSAAGEEDPVRWI